MYYNIYIYVKDSVFYELITKHILLHKIKRIKGIHKAHFVKPDYDYINKQGIGDGSSKKDISKIFAYTHSGVNYDELLKIKRNLLEIPGINTIKTSELEF